MEYKKTRQILLGNIKIGGNAPVSVQTMTKTDTRDITSTIDQIKEIATSGCDIVRLAIPDMEAAEALKTITANSSIPIVADIHFDYRLALKAVENNVAGLRINPGNIGSLERIKAVVDVAKDKNIPIRIGINSGSLEKDILAKYGNTPKAMIMSAKRHIGYLENLSYYNIKISLKSSDVIKTIEACRLFAKEFDYPQHIGVTEAGTEKMGLIKSAVGIGSLLADGIGDTLRVSLTGSPLTEIAAGRNILKSLNLLPNTPKFISCPTCGRIEFDTKKFVMEIEEKVEKLHSSITVAVMGCAVNGPGEAAAADVALCGGKDYGAIYKKGKLIKKVGFDNVVDDFMEIVYQFVEEEKTK